VQLALVEPPPLKFIITLLPLIHMNLCGNALMDLGGAGQFGAVLDLFCAFAPNVL
jgi:hypothetical protein